MENKNCPLCGASIAACNVNSMNLRFLSTRLAEGKLDEAITLAEIAWDAMKIDVGDKLIITELKRVIPDLVRQETDRSTEPVKSQLTSLRSFVEELINKPNVRGALGEKALADSWQEFFPRDQVKWIAGAGQSDLVVIPYLSFNGVREGQKISIERKGGHQKYQANHVTEAARHAQARGASFCIVVYDTEENLIELHKPIHFDAHDGIVIAITDVASGGWRTARQTFEVIQSIAAHIDLRSAKFDVSALENVIQEMHDLNDAIESLRRYNNSSKNNCEKTEQTLTRLEGKIRSYQERLNDLLSANSTFDPSQQGLA